jgi:predicted pyridoxine 5'-phosphate oxidase superfamily flavin-nucleotide-binding protein
MTNETPAPIDLTAYIDTIENAFGDATPTIWATASKDGVPDVAPKGSTMVWDKDHLAFWERAIGTTLDNLRENPHAAMFYRNRDRGVGSRRFFGVAELYPTGEIREAVRARTVQAELDRDPENKGVAVMIRIDRVLDGSREVQRRG